MKELHNHIFSNTTCISKETMLRYINKQLSQQELYEVEKHMLDCELCSDAIAGMKYAENASILFAIDNKIDQRVRGGQFKTPIMRNLMVAASVLVIVFGTYFTVNYFNKAVNTDKGLALNFPEVTDQKELVLEGISENGAMEKEVNDIVAESKEANNIETVKNELSNNQQYRNSDNTPVQLIEEQESELNDVPNDDFEVVMEDEEEAAVRVYSTVVNEKTAKAESKKQLEASGGATTTSSTGNNRRVDNNKPAEVLKNKDKGDVTISGNVSDYKSDETKTRSKSNELAKRKFKNDAPVPTMAKEEMAADFDDRKQSNTVTINGHKVVDYTAEYQKQYDLKQTIKTESTSANFATVEDKEMAEKERDELTVEITYKATLEKAIAMYKNQKYTQAIEQFNIILAEHPDEVNGWFYGGLSNYHLKRYDKADKDLDKVLANPKTDFNQEAKWYKALSLIELKQIENAKKLLKEIIGENGFYKTKAEMKLKEL